MLPYILFYISVVLGHKGTIFGPEIPTRKSSTKRCDFVEDLYYLFVLSTNKAPFVDVSCFGWLSSTNKAPFVDESCFRIAFGMGGTF